MNPNALVIMAKEPRIGSTKTRLCPPLTPEEAAAFYEALLLDTIRLISGMDSLDLAIAITPADARAYFERIAPAKTILIPVERETLGECLAYALNRLLEMGYKKVFAFNADSPSLPAASIQQAVNSLEDHDLALGPAADGGYYLVGFKESRPEIFHGVDWGTDQVLSQTLKIAKKLDLSVAQLPDWYDIDTAADLYQLKQDLADLAPESLPNTRRFLGRWPGE